MTREEAIKMAKADLKCMKRDISGQDEMCNSHKCDECSLNYERGNMGEQKEWLRLAIKALEQEPVIDKIRAEIEAISKAEVKNISDNVLTIVREDYIHKADYENRLKADMVAMLRFLWNDIDLYVTICDYASSDCISKWQVHEIIQEKINALNTKVGSEDNE